MVVDQKSSYYGGSQMWCEKKLSRDYGCGVVAAVQVLLHLQISSGKRDRSPVAKEEFLRYFDQARRKFLIIPFFGINGFFLAGGTRWMLREDGFSHHVRWGVWPGRIWDKTREMLEADLPVVLAIGPSTIPFSKKHQVTLYDKQGENYVPKTRTFGHYVTITEVEDKWITVSSWGKRYYISCKEFENYARRYSNWLFSNILYMKKRN